MSDAEPLSPLPALVLVGWMAPLDANVTQRERAEAIVRRGHYRMAVKANQQGFLDDLNRQFANLGMLMAPSTAARTGDRGTCGRSGAGCRQA